MASTKTKAKTPAQQEREKRQQQREDRESQEEQTRKDEQGNEIDMSANIPEGTEQRQGGNSEPQRRRHRSDGQAQRSR